MGNSDDNVVSVSSTTPLAKEASFEGDKGRTGRHAAITGIVFTDKAGTLHIEQSVDGTNWDVDTNYAIGAGEGKGFQEPIVGPFWRVRFVNGAAAQTAFRIFAAIRQGF